MSKTIFQDKLGRLQITSFYGGAKRGECLQLTISQFFKDKGYLQLERDQVREIYKALCEWLIE